MPKVYTSQRERAEAEYRRRIRTVIKSRMAGENLKQNDLATALGISQGGISQAIRNGSLSLVQMIQLDGILHFTDFDMKTLFGRSL